MKSMLAYAMMLVMAEGGNMSYSKLTDEEKERLKAIAEKRRIDQLKQRGVNEYFYGDNVVYARNKKNADRKARNKGYL